jgi:hypothetical protein
MLVKKADRGSAGLHRREHSVSQHLESFGALDAWAPVTPRRHRLPELLRLDSRDSTLPVNCLMLPRSDSRQFVLDSPQVLLLVLQLLLYRLLIRCGIWPLK